MSPLLTKILEEIEQLTIEEKFQIITYTIEKLKNQTIMPKTSKHSLCDLRGILPNILEGKDAQEWVGELRQEWQQREK
ncbi:hypothetical protein AFK68_05065 [Hydrocoleum sp. CS-953]|uniref:hypothetical protein n=1 Tax=Hydrocoleum sp. CS-953 TaxID=1671698 RepID=UPI000B9B1E3E|nr:hypothetical protein [Hydrocoleum sp. CS-953]OZH55374.1 hypothetical protein AFK68_05065 [Hydrocoleum sp. CS-953]